MNLPMIKSLVLKDWRLNRSLLIIYLVSGVVASAVFSIDHKATFYVGLVLIISLFATVGTHLVFTTVIHERKEQTLPFIMSLPVNFRDYTIAKIFANLSLSLFSWGFIAAVIMLVIWNSSNLPNGMIPFAAITIA
ncbi:MAG: ABC-2 transporter permease, partial [Kangiellaceae bacterium]|nr:ABC-2 transporter permease [Kangiellaceae bacterium]